MSASVDIVALLQARVGTELAGKYRLTRVLGIGGMGAVFEAQNAWTERRVAIKVMIGERVNDPDVVGRFLQEARAASKIEHENIVDVLDMGQDPADGTLYIVQEFLVGRDLRHMLDERHVLSPREAYEYLTPIMSALIAAHDRGIVHRDLKPENMFITRTSSGVVPKLIDFGIAKVMEPGRPVKMLTRTGETMGTPHYMSPEQARGEKEIDAQTDVWAMGAVWFEALAGRCPFEGDSYNQLLARILVDPVPELATLAPAIPPTLARTIQTALQRDRTVRYRAMPRFLRALLEVPDFQQADWMRAIRTRFAELVAAEEFYDAPTALVPQLGSVRPSSGDENVATPVLGGGRLSTMRGTPREIERGTSPSRRVNVWTAIALAAAGVIALGTTLALRNRGHSEPSVAVASPVAPLRVHVDIDPPSADVTFDDHRVGHGPFETQIARDTATHTLGIAAAGFEPWTITFSASAPPPTSIRLRPLPPAAPAPNATGHATVPAMAPAHPTHPSGTASSNAHAPATHLQPIAPPESHPPPGAGHEPSSPTHGTGGTPVLRPRHSYP